MPNADQNHGIDPKCRSIPINSSQCRSKSWHWSALISIDRHWEELIGIDRHWPALIGIDRHWDQWHLALIEAVLIMRMADWFLERNCGEPPTINNGSCTPSPDTLLGGNCTYVCDKGYHLIGPETAYCHLIAGSDDVKWNETTQTCSSKDPSLPVGTNSWNQTSNHNPWFCLNVGMQQLTVSDTCTSA